MSVPQIQLRCEPPRRLIVRHARGVGCVLAGVLIRLVGGDLRRDVVARSLYGVDLNPAAVRLTELRLWLALVADDDTADAAAVAPLPNLDGHVRQGDALLDPYTAATALAGNAPMPAARADLARAAAARRALYGLTGPRKRDAVRELAAGEAHLARRLIDHGVARLEARIAELLAAAKTRDLFGRRPGFDSDQRVRLSRLRAALRDLRVARRRLARDGGAPFFAFESHFGDLMARGGFDVVIGNPPWVRGELRRMGYTQVFEDRTSGPINAIMIDRAHGTLWGGSSNHGEDYGIGW